MKIEINDVLRPIVRVNVGGSGLLVRADNNQTYVLTNAHVVEELVKSDDEDLDLKKVPFIEIDTFICNKYGELEAIYSVQGQLIAYDDINDLAMIKLKNKVKCEHVVKLPTKSFCKKISVFDPILIVGCSLARPAIPSQGIISSLNSEHGGQEYWMTTAPIVTGNSGGGCFKFDEENNQYVLIGMPTAVSTMDTTEEKAPQIIPHINYIIPAPKILSFLKYVSQIIS